jgi:uncharacterized membrane protein
MSDHLQNELKKEFQLERFILFSDAVFAIAITLLVIEIKVPEIDRHTATDAMLLHSLDELIPKFIGFFISFFIIGLYWTVHHRMFGYVHNYTRKLLWLNLIFLLAIVLMPFSTAFYSEYVIRGLKVPVILYVVNIVFLGVMNFLLWTYISNPRNKLSEGITPAERRYFTLRTIIPPLTFLIIGIVYMFVDAKYSSYVLLGIPLVMRLIRKLLLRNIQPK